MTPDLVTALDVIDLQLVAGSDEVVLPRDHAQLLAALLTDLLNPREYAWCGTRAPEAHTQQAKEIGMTSLTTNAARGAQIDMRFPVTEPETVAGLIGQPSEVTITQYGGDNLVTSITYFGERTAECPHNNVGFYARDYDRDGLPTYAAGHLAEAKRIATEWGQS